jgi:hypothetical protein
MKKLLLKDVALTRWALVVLVAAIQTAGICGDAIAKTGKGHLHARNLASEGREAEPVNSVQAKLVQAKLVQARLGPMRYYGGPKSPMWRGPVEN